MAASTKHSAPLLSKLCCKDYTFLSRLILQNQVRCFSQKSSDKSGNSESVTSIRIDSEIVPPKSTSLTKSEKFTKAAKAYIFKLKRLELTGKKEQKISRAMKAYLEKSKQYETALDEQTQLYEVGKRHLANIMGEDPEDFTHSDVNKAIKYLLPSGLHEPKARPVMKLPVDILPLQKVARFGADGRPFHSMFYTGKPMYYEMLYEIRQKLEELREKEIELALAGKYDSIEGKKLDFVDSAWIGLLQYQKFFKEEEISEDEYKDFLKLVQRLADHPMNYEAENFIMKFRYNLHIGFGERKIKGVRVKEDGTKNIIADGRRKTSQARVLVTVPGTGKFTCNGKSILYFMSITCREQILFPIQFVGMVGKIDISARVRYGGSTGQSGAIRLAISRALLQIVDNETAEKMRLAGLLTPDPRMRERKKPFKKGARKGRVWKRR